MAALKSKRTDHRIPINFSEACYNKSCAAEIDREYDALVNRGTWKLIPLENGMKPVPFLWDFKIKEAPGTSTPLLHKARCCLRGDKKQPYLDFDPKMLYAPVARHKTIRMLLAKFAAQDLFLQVADISNDYLYGDLDKPVIMSQPTN